MSNQKCKVRPALININSNMPLFYPYSVLVSNYSGSCIDITNPYASLYIADVDKNMNIKVFNLMSRTYEARHIE